MSRLSIIAGCLTFLACTPGIQSKEVQEKAIRHLENREAKFRRDTDSGIRSVVFKRIKVSHIDLESVCQIGTIRVLEFYNTKIEQGALQKLAKCDRLERLNFEDGAQVYPEELYILQSLPRMKSIGFGGNTYGNELMPYLAKLDRVPDIGVGGDEENGGGALTNEGIQLFAEARASNSPLKLQLPGHPKINDDAFQYFAKIKGLAYVDLGGVSGTTQAGRMRFGEEMKAQGRSVTVIKDGM